MTGRYLYLLALCTALTLPALEWTRTVDWSVFTARGNEFPPGQAFYLLAKLLGMLALSVAVLQIGLSALGRAKLLHLRRDDHRVLGGLIALLALAHAVSFVTGVSIRNGHMTWHLFAPDLLNGSYNRGVGMGVIGLWLMMLGVAVPLLRGRLPRLLHRFALLAVGLAGLHALWIGSEKAYLWGLVGVFVAIAVVGAVLNWRRQTKAA